jgi:hypothetical protein
MKIGRNKLFNIPQTNQLLKHQNTDHTKLIILIIALEYVKIKFWNRHNLLRVGFENNLIKKIEIPCYSNIVTDTYSKNIIDYHTIIRETQKLVLRPLSLL